MLVTCFCTARSLANTNITVEYLFIFSFEVSNLKRLAVPQGSSVFIGIFLNQCGQANGKVSSRR
jgi:hypothetical protein